MTSGPGEGDMHVLPMSYLSLYADNALTPSSFLFFKPEKTLTMISALLRKLFKKMKEITFFPFKSDGCSPTSGPTPIGLNECQHRTRGISGFTY